MRDIFHDWWPVAAATLFTLFLVVQIPRKAIFPPVPAALLFSAVLLPHPTSRREMQQITSTMLRILFIRILLALNRFLFKKQRPAHHFDCSA